MSFTCKRGTGEASMVFSSANIVTISANICVYKLILLFLSLMARIPITDNSNRSRGYKKVDLKLHSDSDQDSTSQKRLLRMWLGEQDPSL